MKNLDQIIEELEMVEPVIVVCETSRTAMLWSGNGFPNCSNVEGSIMFVHEISEDGWAHWDTMCEMGETYRQELNDRLQYGKG